MTELKDLKIYIVDNEDYKISIFKTIFKDSIIDCTFYMAISYKYGITIFW